MAETDDSRLRLFTDSDSKIYLNIIKLMKHIKLNLHIHSLGVFTNSHTPQEEHSILTALKIVLDL